MNLLKKYTILYINQSRQENFDKLIGKGFSEALSWRNDFKRIYFLCYSSNKKGIYKKLYDNCYLFAIPFDLSLSTIKTILNLGKNYYQLFSFIKDLTNKIHIDIIRMENLLLSGPPVYFISKKRKIPFVIWFGGNERKSLFIKYGRNPFTWLLSKLIVLYEIVILKNANYVFPVTDELYQLTEKRKVKNKILSPNYVNLEIFRNVEPNKNLKSGQKTILLYVGRFEEEKGIKTLLEAVKILSYMNINFELRLVGDGSLKNWIEEYIKINQINNVKFLGVFDHRDMPHLYNQGDIFILPSYTEGSPASLIEAMSCGIASIATSVGLCRKIIKNGDNGILISPKIPELISKAVIDLINNKDLFDRIRNNGRKSVEKYIKNYKKIHKFVYESLLRLSNH